MFSLKSASRLGLALSAPIVLAESKQEKLKHETQKSSWTVKPSKLPLYEEPEDLFNYEFHGKEKRKLEEGISVVRKELESIYDATKDTREQLEHFCETGKAHSLASVNYILEEDNVAAKAGVITAGGLLGLVLLGRKKGIIKKLFYTSVSATAVASLLYPKEASQVWQEVYHNAGDYSAIAYNFVAGVKPQSEPNKTSPSSDPPKKPSPSPQPSHPETQSSPVNPSAAKDLVLKMVAKAPKPTKPQVEGDHGQSNPEDKDMYTTRG